MNALRRSSRLARLVAAWVLAWFVAMAAAPFASLAQSPDGCEPAAAHAGHEGHALACDEDPAAEVHAAHAERGTGAGSHCPVCMHAAAPPPALSLVPLAHAAPQAAAAPASIEPPRVHTAAPPPPRGPPRLS